MVSLRPQSFQVAHLLQHPNCREDGGSAHVQRESSSGSVPLPSPTPASPFAGQQSEESKRKLHIFQDYREALQPRSNSGQNIDLLHLNSSWG